LIEEKGDFIFRAWEAIQRSKHSQGNGQI